MHRLLNGATDLNGNGCPDLQPLNPKITIGGRVWYRLVRGRYVGVGRIVSVSAAQLQKGMKLTLRCSRHACKRKSIEIAKVRHGSKATLLKNIRVRKGAKIKISVTRDGNYIGRYMQVRVKTGKNGYPQKTRCIRPGTIKPEPCKKINPQV